MKLKLGCALVVMVAIALSTVPAHAAAGAVYTMDNSSSGNNVLMYSRSVDGQISQIGVFSTGGTGTGKGLGSQGALAIDASNRFLFVVNAGSNDISVFRIGANSLNLVGHTASGGTLPISLTVHDNILYVLNNGGAVGGSDTIAGFRVGGNGHLMPIVHGLSLSGQSVSPPQIGFNVEGNLLLVTEKSTNNIDVFAVDDDGTATGPTVHVSAGQTPFGFAFGKRDELFVSDAFSGTANAGAVSSYVIPENGVLRTVTGIAADNQTAPCWVALTNDDRFAYTTNTGSGVVSGYRVGFNGALQLLNANGQTATTGTGSGPIDLGISNDSQFVYVLAPGTGIIEGFAISSSDGSLFPVTQASSLPSSATGLVAR